MRYREKRILAVNFCGHGTVWLGSPLAPHISLTTARTCKRISLSKHQINVVQKTSMTVHNKAKYACTKLQSSSVLSHCIFRKEFLHAQVKEP